jgi:multidrug efflux pump subunit AcrB
MASTFGTAYINDFNLYGRTFKVRMQADADFRVDAHSLHQVFVRSNTGKMIPLSSLIRLERTSGAQVLERFNGFAAARFTGAPASGYTSGQALAAMEQLVKEHMPEGYSLAWSGSSYQEKISSTGTTLVFALAIIMAFFILAAQYESWSLPLAVLTSVPFSIFGAILANWMRGQANDVYFQVALITLVGLAAKTAVLVVEFAAEKHKTGMDIIPAALEATRLRLRPIVMTSMAFILGCMPLVVSSGAGAASRHAIGTGLVGGLFVATVCLPVYVPVFYRYIMETSKRLFPPRSGEDD